PPTCAKRGRSGPRGPGPRLRRPAWPTGHVGNPPKRAQGHLRRAGMCQAAGVLGLAIAAAVSAAAWVYLVAAHGEFWRTGQRPPLRRPATAAMSAARRDRWPAVVAVVPARNEADSLPT